MQVMEALPAVFISHGSPMTALDRGPYSQSLGRFGTEVRPRAVVVISGHWEAGPPVRISASPKPPMIYDFYGFPPELYAVTYPAPGKPELAEEIAAMLGAEGVAAVADPQRGLDHGTWVPLRLLYPEADIPVVQVSLPQARTPQSLYAMGCALAPLRSRGVIVLGSGGIVHNLFLPRPPSDGPAQAWAVEFDEWIKGAVAARDLEALYRYRTLAPHAAHAVPTTDHFDPVFVTLGAAGGGYSVRTIFEGFQMGHMSLRSFALG